jgi:hypothetical protein
MVKVTDGGLTQMSGWVIFLLHEPWANYLTFLCLSFLTWQMELTVRSGGEDGEN